MRFRGYRRSVIFFITFGVLLVGLAVALNVGWILLNWREVAILVLGIIFFIAIIVGLVLNTIFLVREIRRNEQHDAFINAVTHELKTPIASIRLYLETLQTREVTERQRAEFYDIMLADSDRLLHTVEQVLRAGQSMHRRKLAQEATVDLREVAQDCLQLARTRYPHLAADSFAYEESFANGGGASVRGDAEELRAALANLIDNAVKYSHEGVRVRVEVGEVDARRLQFRVSDEGIGIPRAQLKRIFRRFHRVPGRFMRSVKGTGLGLFIVQAIVRRHGGRIFAESEGEGRGSTFTIQLPRAEQ